MILVLSVACLMAFGRIAGNDFINFDDNLYITGNSHVQSGFNQQSISWAFTTFHFSYWHPVTWLSHMLDWTLFGDHAGGHHIVSLLFHIGAVIFLFLFLLKTTRHFWPAAFAAALFALHPLRVESVAWAAERKDVLSMFFGMAALYAYAFYADKEKISRYVICLGLFALSLMSKPMLVSLPFVLLLLDYWPMERFLNPKDQRARFNLTMKLVREKVPFLALTVAVSIITYLAQSKIGATSFGNTIPFITTLSNGIVSYIAYLHKTFWPVNLALFYPYDFSLPVWKVFISGAVLAAMTVGVVYYMKKIPALFAGWFWYLGTLVPVIGLVQVGDQSMADRYTYLPSIGISIMLAWGIPALIKGDNPRRKILFPAALAFLSALSVVTFHQCGYWKNSAAIFSRALEVTENNYMAHNNLAIALTEEGKIAEAVEHYKKAMTIKPDLDLLYHNRGISYVKAGQYQLAIGDYNQAINLNPGNFNVYNNRGIVYAELGQYQKAMEDFNTAILLNKNFADAYHNRSLTYFNERKREAGCADARKACELGNCGASGLARDRGLCP